MSTVNPYASPSADTPLMAKFAGTPLGMWRDGQILVLRIGTQLPPRCLKTNQPTKEVWRRTLQWHPPWVIVLIFVAILIYIIVALILTKRATFDFPITEPFRARRRNAILVGWGIALLGVAAFIAGMFVVGNRELAPYGGMMIAAGLALPIIGAFYGVFRGRLLWPKQIDDNFAWVNGACDAYLAELPDWPGEYEAYRLTQQKFYAG